MIRFDNFNLFRENIIQTKSSSLLTYPIINQVDNKFITKEEKERCDD